MINLVYYFVKIVIFDLVAGGGGRLLVFGPLSLRMILFLTSILLLIAIASIYKEIAGLILKTLGGISTYFLFYAFWGIHNGANIKDIISDGNFVFTLAYYPLFYFCLKYSKLNLSGLFNYFLLLSLGISISTLIMVLLHIAGVFPLNQLDQLMKSLGYGGNTGVLAGVFPRVYFVSHIFLQIAFSVYLSKIIFHHGNYKNILALILIFLALLVTFTRGFWVGTIISMIVLIINIGGRKSIKFVFSVTMILLVGILFSETFGVYTRDAISERLRSSITTDNKSNLVRVVQLNFAVEQIKTNPLLGLGFGTRMGDKYLIARKLITGRDEYTGGLSIELTYLDLLRKTGVLGAGLFLVIGLKLFRRFKKITNSIRSKDLDKYALFLGYYAGMIGFLGTVATNPYLLNASGMFLVTLMLAVNKVYRFGTDIGSR